MQDGDEVNVYGTDPLQTDSDGDGYPDGLEIEEGTDPLNTSQFPPGTYTGGISCASVRPTSGAALTLLLGLVGLIARRRRSDEPTMQEGR